MNTLTVIEPGFQTTVQDLGRVGFAHAGVARSGAADPFSLRIGNRLLGNDEDAAALEMTLVGGSFVFDQPALVCLAGARTDAACVGSGDQTRRIDRWRPTLIRSGEQLRIGKITRGLRSALCIAGGIRTNPVLGSRSTHLASGVGGLGRALRAGDELPTGRFRPGIRVAPLDHGLRAMIEGAIERRTLRIVAGAHRSMFEDGAADLLARGSFTIDAQSDRVGVRLLGPSLTSPGQGQMKSEATLIGSIQVPNHGRPIILGVDGPTCGGYPVLACIADSDLPALGQSAPGDTIRFQWIDKEHAWELLEASQRLIASVPPAGQHPGDRRKESGEPAGDQGDM